jgi:hypothetical protein
MRLVGEEGEGVAATETSIFSLELEEKQRSCRLFEGSRLDNLDEEIAGIKVDL